MATLECNNGQDACSPAENGDALPEEKSLSIDYSEDLWLANSEDSSGPYPQQQNKVTSQEQNPANDENSENNDQYVVSTVQTQPVISAPLDNVPSQFSTETENRESQAWNAVVSEGEDKESAGQNSSETFINGSGEQNEEAYKQNGEKDFADLVPNGSYGEQEVRLENQDKTFTSLLPAVTINGAMSPRYTAVLGPNQEPVVYYQTSHQESECSTSQLMAGSTLTVTYSQPQLVAGGAGEDTGGVSANNAVYVTIDGLNTDGQVLTAGNFTVLSPALLNMSAEDQAAYAAQLAGSGYQHISTLPFVQNGAYSAQACFASFQPVTAASGGESLGEAEQQQLGEHEEFHSEQASFRAEDASMTTSYEADQVDYQDEDEDEDEDQEDEDGNQDIDENSVEYSEFVCHMCSEAFADQPSLTEHITNHPPLKTFVCETCGKGFATRRYLKYHRKNHCKRASSYEGRNDIDENDPNGDVKRFSCNICSRPFRVLKCMKVHKKKKHSIMKDYTCQMCAVTFTSSQELVSHPCQPRNSSTPRIIHYTPPPLALPTLKKKKKLKQAKPACDICGKTFSDRISVDIHRVKHIEEELYPCDMCDADVEADPKHLAVHFRIRFFTDDNQHILEDQKAAVATHDPNRSEDGSSVSATPIHIGDSSTSAPATPIYLPPTPTQMSDATTPVNNLNQIEMSADLNVQLIEHPAEGEQLIDQSGFAQKFTEFAVSHVDGGTQTYTVSNFIVGDSLLVGDQSVLIGQQSSEQQLGITQQEQQQPVYDDSYEEGEIIHDASGSVMAVTPKKKKFKSSKIHMCDICNKSFADTGKLELHYKSNHLHDRPYQCDVCEKSFFTKWKLQRHMLSHLEHKPHSCPMCSKSFVERGKLEAHYRTHLGTKPYKCDQCPKAFTVKSQLSIHQRRIHSSDQPFGCLVCGKAFLWKSGLDKHMRKHTREKPYICETCGMKYSNKANLIVHMSKAHSQTYVEKQGS